MGLGWWWGETRDPQGKAGFLVWNINEGDRAAVEMNPVFYHDDSKASAGDGTDIAAALECGEEISDQIPRGHDPDPRDELLKDRLGMSGGHLLAFCLPKAPRKP